MRVKHERCEPKGFTPCIFCASHAYGFDVRLDLEREVPPEINRFRRLVVLGLDHCLLECPDCGTIFLQRRLIDNEPGSSTDTIEFEVLPRPRAEELLSWAEKEGYEVKGMAER
mgnify:FL=1